MPNISKELIKSLMETLDSYGCGAHHPDLLPLLDQPEGEPAFWMQSTHLSHFLNKHAGSESFLARCSSRQLHDDYKPCYTHPVAFTTITADMVTDEMIEECYPEYFSKKDKAFKEMARLAIAPAYNAVCKYMGAKNEH